MHNFIVLCCNAATSIIAVTVREFFLKFFFTNRLCVFEFILELDICGRLGRCSRSLQQSNTHNVNFRVNNMIIIIKDIMLTFIFSFINNLLKFKFLEFFYYHFVFNFLRFFCITISTY